MEATIVITAGQVFFAISTIGELLDILVKFIYDTLILSQADLKTKWKFDNILN